MPLTVSILDETTGGERRSAGDFEFATPTATLREIIRHRVQQEVERFNQSDAELFRGIVRPEETERMLNGVRQRPVLDWQQQYAKALASFEANGFVVFLGDRQITGLDEPLRLAAHTKLTFLKLVPLIGG